MVGKTWSGRERVEGLKPSEQASGRDGTDGETSEGEEGKEELDCLVGRDGKTDG